MSSLIVLLIIAGCVAYQFLKGTFVRAVATIIITICASVVAFGYFESIAEIFVSRSDSKYTDIVPWIQPLSFTLLFIVSFAVLQTVVMLLTRSPIDLGPLPERIGRAICGIFLGLIISGILLTALAMGPLPNKYPYQRFNERNPDDEMPKKVLLNADGFVTGWFSMLSNGSFSAISNKKSFATLHPAFLDQVFLNRHRVKDKIAIITSTRAIELPTKRETPVCWYAPEDIKDTDGNPLQRNGYNLIIVRVGIKRAAIRQAGTFTPSQLRLICKPKTDENPLLGKATNVYPSGYLKAHNLLQKKKLGDKISIGRLDSDEKLKWIDFGFYVPEDSVPVLVEFKLNNIAEVTAAPVPAEQAPPVMPLDMESEGASERDTSSTGRRDTESGAAAEERPGLSNLSESLVPTLDQDN